MIISKKALPRRTFLRGVGAAVALPLLDAMVPSMTALARTPASPVRRLGFVYIPMGSDIARWTPPVESGALTQLSPSLSPLVPVQDRITVVSNLELKNSYPGTHATSNAGFLSAAKAKWTESSDYYLGTTVDQIAAQKIGQETQLPSLELAMDLMEMVGQCDNGYACVYQEQLVLGRRRRRRFRLRRIRGSSSSASSAMAAGPLSGAPRCRGGPAYSTGCVTTLRGLQRQLGPEDRVKVSQYLDSVREVERRIQRAEAEVDENLLPDLDRPIGVPAAYSAHVRLMFDLQALALQGDVTRVITFQLARESSNRTYTEVGVSDPHHPTSHHGNDLEKLAMLAKINQFHVSLFAYFLEKLKGIPDGDGSLLDHTLYLYGSGMGNSNVHDHVNLPIVVAGGGGGVARGGRHIKYAEPEPMANLHLTLLDSVGVELDSFADSTGTIDKLLKPISLA